MTPETLPDDIAALQTALAAERAARHQAEARASGAEAMVAYLKLLIAKMKRERFGQSAERGHKLLDQLELQLEELEASASEDEVGPAEPEASSVHATRNKPVRAPLPAHLPRERVVVPAPPCCPCCGGKLAKLGEDVTETLEVVPRQWKVIQTVREKFTCRSILQADAYGGFGDLYDAQRQPGPITEAACWSHSRRKFFELADLRKAPLAIEAVRRIDAIFAIEREINGAPGEQRLAFRNEQVKPLVSELEAWMRAARAQLSRHADLAKAIDYMLKRWPAFTRFLDDGRICLSNNAAERALRGIALGRRAWLFAGSDRGGERAAAMYTLITTAKLNGVDPQAWLADVLRRIADHPASRLQDLLPWHWKHRQASAAAV